MPNLEDLKSLAERATGIGRPSRVTPRARKAHCIVFADDGNTPNNSRFAFVIYRSPVDLAGASDPAAVLEVLFASHARKPAWRDTIYGYNHFHTKTHEVLGIARGHARVRFGGERGRIIEVKAGDVFVLPAGVGHRRLSASKDFLAVGAHPRNGGPYDEPRPEDIDHDEALKAVDKVGLPEADPVYGRSGPLMALWRSGAKPRRAKGK